MIAVVGLGNIGLAIARRLVVRSREVIGIDLDEGRRDAWRAMTGRDAASELSEVDWSEVDTVFVIVRLADQAEDVLRRLAALPGERPRIAYVITTLDAEVARRLGSFNGRSLRVIELPVSGGEIGAMAGKLTVMATGPLEAEDERFLLGTIASNLVRFDAYGEPTLAKLFNNVLGAYNATAFSKILLLGEQAGLDPSRLYRVILTSSGGSWIAGGFLELLDDLLAKDVELLRSTLDGLPPVDLDGARPDGFPAVLTEARRVLSTDA